MKKIFSLSFFLFFSSNLFAVDSIVKITSPSILITRVRIMDKDTTVQELYELDYKTNKIIIDFLSTSEGKIYYKYQMSRIDNNWVESVYPSVQYTNLAPGEYIFSVSAVNENGAWSEQPSSLHFIINPPYWQTWWFKLILFDIVVIGLMLFENFRFKKAVSKERKKFELERKISELELAALRSQMNPHFIFNALNSIQRFITDNDQKSANKYLVDFSKLIRRIIENSQAKSVSIAEEIDTLKLYLQLEILRMGENKMEYEIKIDEAIDIYNEEIPPLLIQPYVENSIWHGISGLTHKGKIEIDLKKFAQANPSSGGDNNFIVCTVKDNGIGRVMAEKMKNQNHQKSRGMSFTQERLEIFNSLAGNQKSVEITDLYNEKKEAIGTEVKIFISTENG